MRPQSRDAVVEGCLRDCQPGMDAIHEPRIHGSAWYTLVDMAVAASAPKGVIEGHGTAPLGAAVRFTRAEYYALSRLLRPEDRYELLDGILYALTQPGPPHASTVAYLDFHLTHGLDRAKYLVKSENALEIDSLAEGTPQPDIAVVTMRADFYATRQPTGADAHLVIEVGDTERNPREKMRLYMRDGRIPLSWRIDIPGRCVEIWQPSDVENPLVILRGEQTFAFEGVVFAVSEIPALMASV
jgi:Uma2 family endonuclease